MMEKAPTYFFKKKKFKDLYTYSLEICNHGKFYSCKIIIYTVQTSIQLNFSYGILASYKIVLKKNSQGQII